MIEYNNGTVKRKVAIGQSEVVVCCRGEFFDEAAERITQISNPTDKWQAAGQWTRLKSIQNSPEHIKRIARSLFNLASPIKLEVCPLAAKNQEGLRTDERVAPKPRDFRAAIKEKTVRFISQQLKEIKGCQLCLNLFKSRNNIGRGSSYLSWQCG